MAEISNTTLALLVFATLIAVVTSTVVLVNRETAYSTGGITGFAPVDTGVVNLTIEAALHIQVDPGNDTIDFGTCAPRAGFSYWCASNDTLACDGAAGGNCTGDTATPQFLLVENVGNVNASVNVSTAVGCDATGLIGGTGPLFQYVTTNCQGTNITAWTSLTDAAEGTSACDLLAVAQNFRMYANITIPQDAAQTCPGGQATITFTAVQAP